MSMLASFKVYSSSVSTSAERVFTVFDTAIRAKQSSTAAIKILKGEGISYRRQDMLEDFRRAGSLTRVGEGNIQGQMKALDYFNKVVEPYRAENKLTSKEAWKDIHDWQLRQYKTTEEAERLEGLNIEYHFDKTPTFEEGAERLSEYAEKYGFHI